MRSSESRYPLWQDNQTMRHAQQRHQISQIRNIKTEGVQTARSDIIYTQIESACIGATAKLQIPLMHDQTPLGSPVEPEV